MNRYRHIIPALLMTCGLAGLPHIATANDAEVVAPVEHHIYLHVVPPKAGETLRVFVSPHAEAEVASSAPAPVPVDDPPAVEETEAAVLVDEQETEADTEAEAEIAEATEPEADGVLDDMLAPAWAGASEDDAEEAGPVLRPSPPVASLPSEPSMILDAESRGAPMGLLFFIFVLAIFLGFELISKVPSQLHTPLMSGSNAISGITIVGALAAAGLGMGGAFGTFLGTLAVAFAAINVVGGYMVTNRMLAMFKKKDGGAK